MDRKSKRKTKAQKKASKVKRRGAKRCPACMCNTFIDGGCSCGYGRKYLSLPEIEGSLEEIGIEALAVATILSNYKTRR